MLMISNSCFQAILLSSLNIVLSTLTFLNNASIDQLLCDWPVVQEAFNGFLGSSVALHFGAEDNKVL